MVAQHYRWDFIGLSTDTKPTPETSPKVVDGSTFYCSDTSKLYVFCKDTWYEKVVEGGGGTTYTAGDGIDITNAIISATNTGKARVLTTADYNYPTNNPTGVALWLLEPGLYLLPSVVVGYTQTHSGTPYTASKGVWLVARHVYGDDPAAGLYLFNGVDKPQYFTTKISDGARLNGQTYFTTVVNSLTSTSSSNALSANQGRVLKDLIDSLVIKNAGAPTTATVGTVGQLLEDTSNGKLYQCTAIDNTDPQNIVYTWTEVGGGSYTAGSGIDITSGVISVTNTGKAKELTTADYDYPDANPTGVALWRLEAGIYKITGNTKAYCYQWFNTPTAVKDSSIVIVSPPTNTFTRIVEISSDTAYSPRTCKTSSVSGQRVEELNFFYPIVNDTLTSTSTRVPLTANQGRVLKDLIDSLVIKNAGAPTTATVGTVGQLLEDTTNGKLYQCTAIDNTDPQNIVYTWSEVGGGGVTPVQTTGTSTTDVMSQNATTSMVFGSNTSRVKIGNSATTSASNTVAIGDTASASAPEAMALGYNTGAHNQGSVALGATSLTSVTGEIAIGPTSTTYGYNNSNYRLISGVYDGQSAHDAATVGQITPTTDSSAPTSSTAGRLGEIRIDTTDNSAYMCVVSDSVTPTYEWKKITA